MTLCARCKKRPRPAYHAWCNGCRREYTRSRAPLMKQRRTELRRLRAFMMSIVRATGAVGSATLDDLVAMVERDHELAARCRDRGSDG